MYFLRFFVVIVTAFGHTKHLNVEVTALDQIHSLINAKSTLTVLMGVVGKRMQGKKDQHLILLEYPVLVRKHAS